MWFDEQLAQTTLAKRLSPVSYKIKNGSSRTALNVPRVTRQPTESETFFETSALNRRIIFEYPNFSVEIARDGGVDYTS
jgi:hypothetical protein